MEESQTKEPLCSFNESYTIDKTCTNGEESFASESDVVDDICFVEETLSNSDNLEVESGVESATAETFEAELLELGFSPEDFAGDLSYLQLGDLDLTTEQAQETLKYFSEYWYFLNLV